MKHVHGSAGFSGFARGGVSRDFIQHGRIRFVHFIESCRFDGGVYANLARRAIESL